MNVRFRDVSLDRLETDAKYDAGFSQAVVTAFRRRMQMIRGAPDERVFRAMKSLHFERLEGPRKHQHSIRLNDQWRLILEFEGKGTAKVVVVVEIKDYH